MTVGLAFYYFSDKKVDIAIIEVGIGDAVQYIENRAVPVLKWPEIALLLRYLTAVVLV